MAADTTTYGVSPADLAEFARWYEMKYRRVKGRPPAPRTVKLKLESLSALSRFGRHVMQQTPNGQPGTVLHELVRDRGALETAIETWLARSSVSTVRNRLFALMDYGAFLVAKGEVPACVVTKADVPPMAPPPPVTIYKPDEVDAIVGAARGRGLRWWALMAFLADTGRRIGEALALEWSWFDLRHSPAYIAIPRTKNGDAQYIPLTRRLVEDVFTPENVERLRQETRTPHRQFLRSTLVHPFPWTYSTVHGWFRDHCARLGIEHRGLHNLRHTCITNRLAAGVPPQAVSVLAGHRNLQTTMQRYAHASSLDYWRFIEPPAEPVPAS